MDQFDDRSQLTHPQPHDAILLTSCNDVLRPEEREALVSKEKDIGTAIANTETFGPHTQAQVLNRSQSQVPVDSAAPVAAPVAMHLQGAHIGGNTRLTNVRGDYTVNNYGEFNGLEKLEKFVSFEAQFDSSAQDPTRRCHPGTRKNVLKRLRDWIDNPNSTDRIFWLHGPAGAGKSAIAQTIAHSYARPRVAASFFFFKSDVNRNDGNRLFTTLAYQLALSMPEIREHIIHSLSERPDLPLTGVETQFKQLLVRPFQVLSEDVSQELAPVIIIDGVDECTDDDLQRRFLKVIGNAVKDHDFPLRFLVVSRPELHIEQTIRCFQPSSLTIDLANLDDANRDIEKYLVEKFFHIASEQGLDPAWPGREIINDIVYKSSGNFIFPSLVIRFVGDHDNIAETQLDIVLNIKPPTTMTPFAILDLLFFEILGRVPDQDFLKRYLTLLVARISASIDAGDDAVLMHVSEKELHAKLRRMRSLLKFKSGIELHHRSFLDFLHDSSRSGHYYIRKQGGIRGYLEVFVDSLVRYVSAVVEQPDHHNAPHFMPRFREKINSYPPKIELGVKEWYEVVQPLLDLQEKLLQLPTLSTWDRLRCDECTSFNLLRELPQLAILKELSFVDENKSVRTTQMRRDVMSPITTSTTKNMDNDLNSILLASFALLPETMDNCSPNQGVIDLINTILRIDYAETATRIRSVSDAQKLVNLLDYMIHSKNALHLDVTRNARLLASEIFARVSIVFRFPFLNGNNKPHYYIWSETTHIEILSQTIFAARILDRRYIVPVFGIIEKGNGALLASAGAHLQSMQQWRLGSIPSSVTVIQIMLRLANAIQHFHSMNVILYHQFLSDNVLLDSNLCPRICCLCSTSRSVLGKEFHEWFSPEDNISSFGCLFYEMYIGVNIRQDGSINYGKRIITKVPEIPEYAWQLIQRCCAEHSESRPTIDDVVNEMEGWHVVEHIEPGEAVNQQHETPGSQSVNKRALNPMKELANEKSGTRQARRAGHAAKQEKTAAVTLTDHATRTGHVAKRGKTAAVTPTDHVTRTGHAVKKEKTAVVTSTDRVTRAGYAAKSEKTAAVTSINRVTRSWKN